MENSYWYEKNVKHYLKLQSNIEVDVAIIGGGLSGLMCAYELIKRGKKVCILEGKEIGSGETSRSSAIITFAHDLIYDKLICKHGISKAKQYYEYSKKGIEIIEKIINDNGIDCDYHKCDYFLYAKDEKGSKKLLKEQKAYALFNEYTEIINNIEIPYQITAALKIKNQGYLNPFKFIHCLALIIEKKGGLIYENTHIVNKPVNSILKHENYEVKAKHFIIATHFPYLVFPGLYFLKMYQHRSYNIVFETKDKISNVYEDINMKGFEYRPVNDGIMCLGANVKTGKYHNQSKYQIVEEEVKKRFNLDNDVRIKRFSAQDCITFDYLPFVGKYSKFYKDTYIITGFNKWGFTNSACAAQIISDLIDHRKIVNPFNPSRLYFIKSPLHTLSHVTEVLWSFINLILNVDAKKIKNIKKGEGAIIRRRGLRAGIYKDHDGRVYMVNGSCAHMGCALKWNKDELTWDCPCHGSRFDIHGNIVDNPTKKGLY